MESTTIETELKAAGMSGRQDLYAGDDAWREWFDVCFVDGCANAVALREQVASAMYAQLARFGFTRADVEGADPVLHFDAYFMLTGSRSKPKSTTSCATGLPPRKGGSRARYGIRTGNGTSYGNAPQRLTTHARQSA